MRAVQDNRESEVRPGNGQSPGAFIGCQACAPHVAASKAVIEMQALVFIGLLLFY